MYFKVFKSISDLDKPISHYDSRIFPDSSRWYELFERYISSNDHVRCIAYARSDDDKHEVLLPTQLRNLSPAFAMLESLDNYYSVDYRPICSSASAQELITPTVQRLLEHERPHMLLLRSLEVDAAEICIIMHALEGCGWRPYASPYQANWTHDIHGDFENYLASRSSRLRNTLQRKTAKLMGVDGMTITVHHGERDLEQALQSFEEIYDNSWKVPEPYPEFVPQLIRTVAELGQLRLGIVRLGDIPVAAHFWIVKRQIAFIYKLAHDKRFDSYSPGTVLMGKMIEYTMKVDNITKLDFLSGDDTYKQDWMSNRQEKIQIHAYNPGKPVAQWLRYRDRHLKPLVKRVMGQS